MSRCHSLTVVYRTTNSLRVLGSLPADFRHARSLDPFVSALLQDGKRSGSLFLIDDATGDVIVKRKLRPITSGRRHE
ncbi:MAG: hypothetical protein M3Y37_00935 [Chloroflexota bacterium]|nr:hypothetical protein [Chloroflexota bacterium]